MDKNVWHWYFFKLLLVIEIVYLKHTNNVIMESCSDIIFFFLCLGESLKPLIERFHQTVSTALNFYSTPYLSWLVECEYQ